MCALYLPVRHRRKVLATTAKLQRFTSESQNVTKQTHSSDRKQLEEEIVSAPVPIFIAV